MRFDPAKIKELVPQRAKGGLREVDLVLAADLRALHLGVVHREYRFDPERKWRFDYCIPAVKLAVEIEGGVWTHGRHTTGSGFVADCVKYNSATANGWTVFRFPTKTVTMGEAKAMLLRWAANRKELAAG